MSDENATARSRGGGGRRRLCDYWRWRSGAGIISPWQAVPGATVEGGVNVSAAGRLWVFGNQASGHAFLIRSARVANGRLGGWVTSSLGAASGWPVIALLGDDLVFLARLHDPTGGNVPVLRGVTREASGAQLPLHGG